MTRKQLVRFNFRISVFKRDNYVCVICGRKAQDAHHITNRNEMPNGGYVKENGISLCHACHIQAERGLNGQSVMEKFMPDYLYKSIQSSKELAIEKSKNIGK